MAGDDDAEEDSRMDVRKKGWESKTRCRDDCEGGLDASTVSIIACAWATGLRGIGDRAHTMPLCKLLSGLRQGRNLRPYRVSFVQLKECKMKPRFSVCSYMCSGFHTKDREGVVNRGSPSDENSSMAGDGLNPSLGGMCDVSKQRLNSVVERHPRVWWHD